MPRRVVIMTDGFVAADGAAGWAFVARTEHSAIDVTRSGALPPATASHLAEWVAVEAALGWAESALDEGDEIELRTDSAIVAKGLASRRPALHGDAAELRAACRQALARLGAAGIKARVVRVRREENAEADAAARAAATNDG
jgi:ribonuclease HI